MRGGAHCSPSPWCLSSVRLYLTSADYAYRLAGNLTQLGTASAGADGDRVHGGRREHRRICIGLQLASLTCDAKTGFNLDYIDCYIIHTPFAFQPGEQQDPRDGAWSGDL